MKLYGFILLVLVSAIAFTFVQACDPPAAKPNEEIDKKIKALEDQLRELRDQKDAAKRIETENLQKQAAKKRQEEAEKKRLEEAERLKREEIEKKKQFAKVEIRGKLLKNATGWQVAINELTWTLNFNNNKELLAFAEKNVGKPVVIAGTIVNKKLAVPSYSNPYNPSPYTPTPYYPDYRNWYPPSPGTPVSPGYGYPQTYYYPVETPVTVNVESLKLAEN